MSLLISILTEPLLWGLGWGLILGRYWEWWVGVAGMGVDWYRGVGAHKKLAQDIHADVDLRDVLAGKVIREWMKS